MTAMASYQDPTAVFLRRLGAWAIDIGLVFTFFVAAEVYGQLVGRRVPYGDPQCRVGWNSCLGEGSEVTLVEGTDAYIWGGLIILGFVFALANFIGLQGWKGATVGKFATGIRTVNARSENAGFGRCTLRTLFGWIDFLCSGLVGIVAYLTSKNHRRVADMIGGTVVVRKAYLDQRAAQPLSPAGAPAMPVGMPPAAYGGYPPASPRPVSTNPIWSPPPPDEPPAQS